MSERPWTRLTTTHGHGAGADRDLLRGDRVPRVEERLDQPAPAAEADEPELREHEPVWRRIRFAGRRASRHRRRGRDRAAARPSAVRSIATAPEGALITSLIQQYGGRTPKSPLADVRHRVSFSLNAICGQHPSAHSPAPDSGGRAARARSQATPRGGARTWEGNPRLPKRDQRRRSTTSPGSHESGERGRADSAARAGPGQRACSAARLTLRPDRDLAGTVRSRRESFR
jgi:hypothetical protein